MEAELDEHLGYAKHGNAVRDGGNSPNGTRTKTVFTEVGPVASDVPRDRDGSFDPKIVRKRQRGLGGVDQMVMSLTAKGLTTGEVQAHLAEVYGTDVSRETISKITDAVLAEMAEWQYRPLDRVYPVVFIDAMVVKIRDGQVAHRPIYCAVGVTVDGKRDILGLHPRAHRSRLNPLTRTWGHPRPVENLAPDRRPSAQVAAPRRVEPATKSRRDRRATPSCGHDPSGGLGT